MNKKYPWDHWTDGKTHAIVRGEDFEQTPATFQNYLHQYARSHDMTVETQSFRAKDPVSGEFQVGVLFTFHKVAPDGMIYDTTFHKVRPPGESEPTVHELTVEEQAKDPRFHPEIQDRMKG